MTRPESGATLDALPYGCVVVGPDACIVRANRVARELAGGDAIDGRTLRDAFGALEAIDVLDTRAREARERGPGRWVDIYSRFGDGEESRRVRIRVAAMPGAASNVVVLLEPFENDADEVRAAVALARAMQTVSNVRHQLTNPLMGIVGNVELLLDRSPLDADARRRVESIGREAQRVADCVHELRALRGLDPENEG